MVGTVIGDINRDLYGKPTGVRLHALVAIASALLVMLAGELGSGTQDHAAASRIIQGIVGGIGFLGAGVILRADKGNRVYHITTGSHDLGDGSPRDCLRPGSVASCCSCFSSRACAPHPPAQARRVLFRHGEPDEDIGPS